MSFETFLADQSQSQPEFNINKAIVEAFSDRELELLGGVDHIVECLEGRDPNDLTVDLNENAGKLKGLPKTWLKFATRFGAGQHSDTEVFKTGIKGTKTIVTHLRNAAKDPNNAAFYLIQGGEPFALIVKDGYGKKEFGAILPDGGRISRAVTKRQKMMGAARGKPPKYRMITFKEPDLSLTDIADRLAFTDDYEQLIPVDIIAIKVDALRAATQKDRASARSKSSPEMSSKALTKMARTRLKILADAAMGDILDQIESQLTAVIESPDTFSGFDIDLKSLEALTSKIQRITSALQSAIAGIKRTGAPNASRSDGYMKSPQFNVEVFLNAIRKSKE